MKHVNNDQCWGWRHLYEQATGRSLNAYFSGIPDEYWPAFAEMIVSVKDIVDEINKRLRNMDWSDMVSVSRVLAAMKSENAAKEKSPSYIAIMEEIATDVVVYSSLGRLLSAPRRRHLPRPGWPPTSELPTRPT